MNFKTLAALLVFCAFASYHAPAQEPTTAEITVKVVGQVKTPGAFKFGAKATITQAIKAAGGLTEFAYHGENGVSSLSRLRVMRADKPIIVNYRKILKGETEDFILQDGDEIQVPEVLS